MNSFLRIVCAVLLPASLLYAGQTPVPSAPSAADAQLSAITMAPFSTDLTPPRIQIAKLPLAPPKGCKHNPTRNAIFLMVLDAHGRPHFPLSGGHNNSQWAVELMQSEIYFPALKDKTPVAVALNVAVSIDTCRDRSSRDEPFSQMRLWRQPGINLHAAGLPITQVFVNSGGSIQRFSTDQVQNVEFVPKGRGTEPRLTFSPEATFPDGVRHENRPGICMFDVIVGANGLVQQVGLWSATDPIFIPNALKAIRQYRFQPATKNGKPVPVMIQIEINFRHY